MRHELRFTEEKLEAINAEFKNISEDNTQGLRVVNGLSGAMVVADNWCVCTVDVLDDMINELLAMKKAITNETGIC